MLKIDNLVTKSFKQFLPDLISNVLPSFAFQLINLLLFPIYGSYLEDKDFQLYAIITVICSFLTGILSFGLDSSFLRFHEGRKDEDINKLLNLIWFRIITIVSAGFPLLIISFKLIELTRGIGIRIIISACLMILTQGTSTLCLTYIRAYGDNKILRKTLFIQGITNSFILIIFIMLFHLGHESYYWSTVISSSLVMLSWKLTYVKNWNYSLDFISLIKSIRYGIHQIPHKILARIPEILIITYILPIYNEKLLTIIGITGVIFNPSSKLIDLFAKAWVPFRMRSIKHYQFEQTKKFIYALTALSVIGFIILIIVSKVYLGINFKIPLNTIVLIFSVLFAQTIYHLYSTGIEFYKNQKIISLGSIFGFLGFIVSLFLSYRNDYVLLSRSIPFLILALIARKYSNNILKINVLPVFLTLIIILFLQITYA